MDKPLALLIEQTRIAIVLSKPPDALTLMVICIVATISAEMSYRFFQKLSRGFQMSYNKEQKPAISVSKLNKCYRIYAGQ